MRDLLPEKGRPGRIRNAFAFGVSREEPKTSFNSLNDEVLHTNTICYTRGDERNAEVSKARIADSLILE